MITHHSLFYRTVGFKSLYFQLQRGRYCPAWTMPHAVPKNITPFARFQFITAELFSIQIFWDVTPLNDSSYRRSKRRWYLKNVGNLTNRYDVPSSLASITSLDLLWTTVLRILGTQKAVEYIEIFIFRGSRFSYPSKNDTLTETFCNVFQTSQVICGNKFETLLLYPSLYTVRWLSCQLKVCAFPVGSQE